MGVEESTYIFNLMMQSTGLSVPLTASYNVEILGKLFLPFIKIIE